MRASCAGPPRCAPAGYEGRYCAVCAKTYDYDEPDAQAMVECERCGLWVHPQCDGMDEQTYMAYTEGAPGYESYLCCDCRPEDSAAAEEPMWRLLARMVRRVQQRRIHFSPELCAGSDAELGVSVYVCNAGLAPLEGSRADETFHE